MGGRGSSYGISVNGYEYGTEFKTLLEVDNIKFVRYQYSMAATIPRETMSADKNRVYVLVNNKNLLKSITFYDKSGKLRRQIDLSHKHNGHMPHVHIGYEHSDIINPLTKSDKAYITKVRRIWESK
jgi:hypothetical protein